jgi:hypothetical protein
VSWLRIDDGFAEHPKVIGLSDRAFRLHVAAMCFCARNLTDGRLVKRSVGMVCALAQASKKHVGELVDAGLWIREDDGYAIKDFLVYNPPAEKVKADRDAARDRMRKLRSRERSGERSASPSPDPSTTSATGEDQKPQFLPPEHQTSVAALVEESLGSGRRDSVPAASRSMPLRRGVDVLIDLLPPNEVRENTRGVLEGKFAQLPPHFVDLAREELIAAGDTPRSRIRYLNGIADRMIRERGERSTDAVEHDRFVVEQFDHPDAHTVIDTFDVHGDEVRRQELHERTDELRAATRAKEAA